MAGLKEIDVGHINQLYTPLTSFHLLVFLSHWSLMAAVVFNVKEQSYEIFYWLLGSEVWVFCFEHSDKKTYIVIHTVSTEEL